MNPTSLPELSKPSRTLGNLQKIKFLRTKVFRKKYVLTTTLDFVDKKHLKFDQGLDFLIFYQGNRGQINEKRSKSKEALKTHR